MDSLRLRAVGTVMAAAVTSSVGMWCSCCLCTNPFSLHLNGHFMSGSVRDYVFSFFFGTELNKPPSRNNSPFPDPRSVFCSLMESLGPRL